MVERKSESVEPLLIPTLRLLVALPLIVISVILLLDYLWPMVTLPLVPTQASAKLVGLAFILAEIVTFLLLIIPGLPTKLGRWFLPLTLFFCTLGPVAVLWVRVAEANVDGLSRADVPGITIFGIQGVFLTTFFLTLPLIVIAWQYSFRQVVLYALALALVDGGMALLVQPAGSIAILWPLFKLSLGRTVIFLTTGWLVARLVAGQRQQRLALAQANRQLAQYVLTQEQLAISRERNRLARDLHDTLAHYISGLVLELEGTRLLWETDSAEARATLDGAIRTARTGLIETRRALQDLRSTPLVDLGLIGAIRDLAESGAARNEWDLQLSLPTTPVVLPTTVDEVVYRVVQEGLTNIERHAEATVVTLSVTIENGILQLQVEDNGCGFVPASVAGDYHYGLAGMQERATLVGGRLEVQSGVGQGTTLRLAVDTTGGDSSSPPSAPSPIAGLTVTHKYQTGGAPA